MGAKRKALIALVALAASLPAQALENGRRAEGLGRAPTCFSGVGAGAPGEEAPPVLIPHLGTPTGLVADTPNTEARQWFEQGLLLVWAYDEAEAIRAFKVAQKLAPGCALCYWGEALARSPTLNLQPPNVDLHAAAAAAATAARLAKEKPAGAKLDWIGQGLIDAMSVRAPQTGTSFDFEGYVQTMAALAERPAATDPVLVLAADAQIVRWSADQTPLDGARRWLETVIARNPNHTGAIHFYIHLADIIGQPAIALEAARRLGPNAPAAPHLVHMPSHSFYGTGHFADAVRVNGEAIQSYLKFETYGPAVSGYRRYLFAHDHHYAIQAALIEGDRRAAIGIAEEFEKRFPVQDPLFRVRPAHFAAPWFAYGRHLPVAEVLAMTEPMLGGTDAVRGLTRVMWHYARGEAYARQVLPGSSTVGNGPMAAKEAAGIADLLGGPVGRSLDPESEALALMAQHVLEGRAAMLAGKYNEAEAAYRLAMNLRFDANLQFDPPPFWYGVRRSVAAALLANGDWAGAKRQIDALSALWPFDPLGLYVRSLAETKLGEKAEAARDLEKARQGWAGGRIEDVPLAVI